MNDPANSGGPSAGTPTRCPDCGAVYDPANLDELIFHTVEGHRRMPKLPVGGWVRVVNELPNESRPRTEVFRPLLRLEAGCRVFFQLGEGAAQISGWGVIRRLPQPLGWSVEFPDGSAVGMGANELKRHCTELRVTTPSSQARRPRTRSRTADQTR
jgi:hypothetical protein